MICAVLGRTAKTASIGVCVARLAYDRIGSDCWLM
jgi:hypothetical protein